MEPTVKDVLNEAEDPDGSFELVNKNLYVGSSTRPTEHVVELTETDEESAVIAEEYLYEAAKNSGYEIDDAVDNTYRLRAIED